MFLDCDNYCSAHARRLRASLRAFGRDPWNLLTYGRCVQDVQDENLALNLEIASQDKRMAAVKAENQQLIERWMKRMGEEADAMNLANEPSDTTGRR